MRMSRVGIIVTLFNHSTNCKEFGGTTCFKRTYQDALGTNYGNQGVEAATTSALSTHASVKHRRALTTLISQVNARDVRTDGGSLELAI
jgi:hypothetical protein